MTQCYSFQKKFPDGCWNCNERVLFSCKYGDLSKYTDDIIKDERHETKFQSGQVVVGGCCITYKKKAFIFR
jgi:hypothetical protein